MTCQAIAIVGRILADDVLVRIVASDATDARIGAVEALAVGQTIRLKANRQFAAPVIPHHRFPGAVTLAAEIRDLFRRSLAEIGRSGIEIAVERIGEMRGCPGMTMLAGHAGAQGFESHFSVRHRASGVTTEADFRFAEFDLASDCFFETARFEVLVPGREIETRNRGIVTHRALVAAPITLENPGLRPEAKIPVNGNGNRARAIAHVIRAFFSMGFDGIGVRAFTNRQLRILA